MGERINTTGFSEKGRIIAWLKWFGMRVVIITPRVLLEVGYQSSKLLMEICDLGRRSYDKALLFYDSIPTGTIPVSAISSESTKAKDLEINPITDLLTELEGKHLLLIGGTGTGKSTIAQWLATQIGGRCRIYDADASPEEWRGLEVVGRGGDYESIESGMNSDLDDLAARYQLRGERGDSALSGQDEFIIAEEFPLLVDEISCAAQWLIKHAKRGRKARKFCCAIAQNDTVRNFGFEGDSGVRDCFKILRLGKIATNHAKRLKSDQLVEWLRGDRSRALLDDEPLQLPPYPELRRATSRSLPASPPATSPTQNQHPEALRSRGSADISSDFETIISALSEGKSADWVVKNILGVTGGSRYSQVKPYIEALKMRGSSRE